MEAFASAPTLPRTAGLLVSGLFATAAFAGAALLFLVEPMSAQLVLPLFGGASAVWITALVFFQAVLLVGYGYAHLSARLLGSRQRFLHMAVLLAPLLTLPIALPENASPVGHRSPALWLLVVLLVTVGGPFLAVTTASPTLQRWFSQSGHESAGDPYFLYAAGNLGSLLALLSYPLLIQPHLTLGEQTRLWKWFYVAFVALCAVCVVIAWPIRTARLTAPAPSSSQRLTWRRRAMWVGLAFIPGSLLVGSTTYITTDIAPIPLLWVAPLGVYLATFVIAFSKRLRLGAELAGKLLPFCVVCSALTAPGLFAAPLWLMLLVQSALLFLAALLAHSLLARDRPATDRLTEFYFWLALGGVLGGVFNAFLAPQLFSSLIEYPLVVALALALRGLGRTPTKSARFEVMRDAAIGIGVIVVGLLVATALGAPTKALIATAALATLGFYRRPVRLACALGLLLVLMAAKSGLYVERDFYGQLIVHETRSQLHVLTSGNTIHGMQWMDGRRREPLGYYTRRGPIGQAFTELQRTRPFRDVGVVGLGVGALAAYGRPGQRFTFIEIDPADVKIATNPDWFTFLRDSDAKTNVIVGDGRLELEQARKGSYDFLVLDAFSSDAIPTHLLTREAIDLELSRLRPHGVLAFHISNRFLNLEPVFAAVARDLHLKGLTQERHVSEAEKEEGALPSHWVIVARRDADIAPLLHDRRWRALAPTTKRAWTDSYSNVAGAFDWTS
jgi:hypothetical protein